MNLVYLHFNLLQRFCLPIYIFYHKKTNSPKLVKVRVSWKKKSEEEAWDGVKTCASENFALVKGGGREVFFFFFF